MSKPETTINKLCWFFGTNFTLSFSILGFLCFLVNFLLIPSPNLVEIFFFWFLVVVLGGSSLWAGIFHIFFQDIAAATIGWKDNPFETEVGIANISFGTLSILAAFHGFEMRFAAIYGVTIFLWGAAIGHVYQMIKQKNFSPGNAGVIFWTDIIFPLTGIILLSLQA